jgi:hypothetical protein
MLESLIVLEMAGSGQEVRCRQRYVPDAWGEHIL